jgi:CspA family cold shock protein
MKKGKVKFFNTAKGFGFIKGDDGTEVFVHVTGLKDEIQENDVVSYDTAVGKKGETAINVRLVH